MLQMMLKHAKNQVYLQRKNVFVWGSVTSFQIAGGGGGGQALSEKFRIIFFYFFWRLPLWTFRSCSWLSIDNKIASADISNCLLCFKGQFSIVYLIHQLLSVKFKVSFQRSPGWDEARMIWTFSAITPFSSLRTKDTR